MKLLLDTCAFLWWTEGSPRLPERIRSMVSDPTHDVYVSTASIWEISVNGFLSLPIDDASVLQLHRLPRLHKDPCDRLLVCQAIEHGMTLLTSDRLIAQYPVRTSW